MTMKSRGREEWQPSLSSIGKIPKLLIFTMNFWPEPTGIGPLATDLADYLASSGWKVTVIAGMPSAPKWEVYEGYRGRMFKRESRQNIDIFRAWLYVPRPVADRQMSALRRIAFDTSLFCSGLPLAMTLPRQDAIVAVCPPLQAGLAALFLKRLWHAPVLYWVQDIVPDAAVNTGMMRDGTFLKIGRILERKVYRGVDKIGIISHGFQVNLESKAVPQGKILFLPNWADVAQFDNGLDGKAARHQQGFSERDFVLLHAGSISAKQYMENVVRAMKLLETHTDIHLVIIGNGNRLEAVRNETERLKLARVRFLPLTTVSGYIDLLRAADVLIVNQLKNVKEALIPSKLLTYLPSERPVLAAVHEESETARFIRQANCGLVVQPESPDELAAAVLSLKQAPDLRLKMGRAGASFIRENFDRPVLLRRFASALAQMIVANSD